MQIGEELVPFWAKLTKEEQERTRKTDTGTECEKSNRLYTMVRRTVQG